MATQGKTHISVCTVGHVDAGKTFLRDTPILLHDCTIKMVQDIKVGDHVMGDDSRPRLVTKTTTGFGDMYDVVPLRFQKYSVTADHDMVLRASNYEMVLWEESRQRYRIRWLQNFSIKEKSFSVSAYGSQDKARNAAETYLNNDVPLLDGYTRYGDIVEIKAKDLAQLPRRVQDAYKVFSVGVDFPHEDVPIDPYVLGYWLGDGTSATTEFTTADEEIVEYMADFAKSLELNISQKSEYSYNISTGTNFGGKDRNEFRNFLKEYNLLNNKHIPDLYLKNSREVRLKVLAGLIDSDGYNDKNNYEFCLKSKTLADNLALLARTLGYHVTMNECEKTCTNAPGGPKVGTYHRLHIGGDTFDEIPVLLARKQTHQRESAKNSSVSGFSITPVGQFDHYGFETDGNHRFLLGDFQVTHNSTTTGHLLYLLGTMDERTKLKLEQRAKELGKDSFSFAFFMDTTKAEQERGITIQTTTREFFTSNYHYSIVDCPGHKDFVKNMVSGASQCDVAIILVPAETGGFETAISKHDHKSGKMEGQTRQHARLCQLLGIQQAIVCVNKMDTVKFSEERFNEIKGEMQNMMKSVGWKVEEVPIIPICGYQGYNLKDSAKEQMPWYTGYTAKFGGKEYSGYTLYDALDTFVQPTKRNTTGTFRMPISNVLKIPGIGNVVCGRIEQGVLNKGVRVGFTHSKSAGKAFSIEMHHRQEEQGLTGENIGVNVKFNEKDVLPKNGDVMYVVDNKDPNPQKKVTSFKALVVVVDHPGELKPANAEGKGGYCPMIMVRTAKAACKLNSIAWKIGKDKIKIENPPILVLGDQAEVEFTPQHPIYVEKFTDCQGLGRVAVMDSNTLVMLGKVINVTYE